MDGDDAFLLTDINLDVQRYNDTDEDVTWETCTMRSWLNGYGADKNVCGNDYSESDFLDNAFTESGKIAIKDTVVVNEDNSEYSTEGGENTVDKVYLLSLSEVKNPSYGFTSTRTRGAVNTAYVADGGEIKSFAMYWDGCADFWWLRSPGSNNTDALYVLGNGEEGVVLLDGRNVDVGSVAVRPVLHLNLSDTSVWTYAGTVSMTGEENELPAPNPPVTPSPLVPSVTPSAGYNPASVTSPAPAQHTPMVEQEEVQKTDEKVIPAKVTGLELVAKKKAIEASWKKVSGATGYEIQVSNSKKFTKKSTKTTKKMKLTIGKLKPKTKYFVRVRAYSVTNGKKHMGSGVR